MAGMVSLRTVGKWDKQIGVPLDSALAVSMDIMGRSGQEACKHAIILMAQSARAITPQSPKLRKVVKNPDDSWKHDRRKAPWGVMAPKGTGAARKMDFKPIFRTGEYGKIRFYDKKSASWFEHWGPDANTWKKIASGADEANPSVIVPGIMTDKRRIIGRRGLAKQSWMWGLKDLGSPSGGKEIPGVARIKSITSETVNGYILENELRYVMKIMPAGWERTVELRAGNKIMIAAARKLESKWRREVGAPKGQKITRPDVSQYFLKQAGAI